MQFITGIENNRGKQNIEEICGMKRNHVLDNQSRRNANDKPNNHTNKYRNYSFMNGPDLFGLNIVTSKQGTNQKD